MPEPLGLCHHVHAAGHAHLGAAAADQFGADEDGVGTGGACGTDADRPVRMPDPPRVDRTTRMTKLQPLADVLVSGSGALQTSTFTAADGSYTLKVGLGDNTVSVEDLDGLNSPNAVDLPTFTTPGNLTQFVLIDFLKRKKSRVR